MEDREPLLPKDTTKPHENVVSENYQTRRYESIERPNINGNYYSTTEEPAELVQPGAFRGNRILINPTNFQRPANRVPSDYSGYAWLSLLFCCFPLSVAAVYQSNKVIICIRKGDLDDAWDHSRAAKKLSALAIIYGILFIVLAIGLYFIISVEVTHTI